MAPRKPKIESDLPRRAREVAFILYEGEKTAHRSCGVAIAETFRLNPRPYVALRMGGITKKGGCGAIQAGDLVLAEILGPPDPVGPLTDTLREAILSYRKLCEERLGIAQGSYACCENLVERFGEFTGSVRKEYCAALVATVARAIAETILRFGGQVDLAPLPGERAP